MKKLPIPMLALVFLLFGITCDVAAYTADVSYFFDGVKLDPGAVFRDQTTLIVVFGEPEFLPDIADVIRPGVPRPGDFFLDVPSASDGLVDVLFAETSRIDGYLTFAETMFDAVNHDLLAYNPLNTDLAMVTIQPEEILAVRTMDNIWYKVMFTATPQWGTLTARWEQVPLAGAGPVPEPGTLVLLGLGVLGIATLARHRKVGARANQIGLGLLLAGSVSLLLPVWAQAKTIFADNQLTQNCVGNYAIAARSCTGSDGDAYSTIKAAASALLPGDTLNIRGGTYPESNIMVSVRTEFDRMTTIQAYQAPGNDSEVVSIFNSSYALPTFTVYSLNNNPSISRVTFKHIRMSGTKSMQQVIQGWEPATHPNTGQPWPNVWQTSFTEGWLTRLMFDTTLYNGGTGVVCLALDEIDNPAKTCRWYHDRSHFEEGMLYFYSPEGDPDVVYTNPGIRVINAGGQSGIDASAAHVVIDHCSFTEFTGSAIGGGYTRWWIKNSVFDRNGLTSYSDHIYIYGIYAPGQESIIEHNYFGDCAGSAIKLGSGAGGPGSEAQYFIIRNNLMLGNYREAPELPPLPNPIDRGMKEGITLSGAEAYTAYNTITNNTIYGSLHGIYLYGLTGENTISNNIFYGTRGDLHYEPAPFSGRDNPNIIRKNFLGSPIPCIQNFGASCPDEVNIAQNMLGPTSPFLVEPVTCWTDLRLDEANSLVVNTGEALGETSSDQAFRPEGLNCQSSFPPITGNQSDYGAWEVGAFLATYPAICLTPPETLSPTGTLPSGTIPELQWQRVSAATSYRIILRGRSFGVTQANEYTLNDSSCSGKTCLFTVPDTLLDGEYLWWVQPVHSTCPRGAWSVPLSFVIGCTPPDIPDMVAPTGNVTTSRPTFTWETVDFAKRYKLYVANSSGVELLNQEYDQSDPNSPMSCNETNCAVTPALDLSNDNYIWQIIAYADCGHSQWSSRMPFTVTTCVTFEPPILHAPKGTITAVTPTFTWQHTEQADAYWFWLQIEQSPTALYTVKNHPAAGNCDADTCWIAPPVTLQSGVTYHWSVSPVQTGCSSEVWGDGLQFTVTNSASCANPIIFESDRDGDREIFMMCPDGSNVRQLTQNTCVDGRPSLSPDGQKIVFVSNCDGNDDIYTMNIDGSQRQRLTTDPGNDWWPMWSPDGTQIVFDAIRPEHSDRRQIYVMNADGSNQRRVSNGTQGDDADASWSPDGKRITFWSTRINARHLDIYTMNANGSDVRHLGTSLYAVDGSPSYSPDGTKILFGSNGCAGDLDAANGYDPEICVMNTDGTGQVKLTENGFRDINPRWSPDGTQIVFESYRDGNAEIYVMNADGRNQHRLTSDPSIDMLPDWGVSEISPRQVFTIRKAANATGEGTIRAGNLFCDPSCQELRVPVTPNSALVIQAIPSPLANVSVRWEKPDGTVIPAGMLHAQPGDTVIAVFEKQ